MGEVVEMPRERLVFLANMLRHVHRTASYLLEEFESLSKWIEEQIPELEEKEAKQ